MLLLQTNPSATFGRRTTKKAVVVELSAGDYFQWISPKTLPSFSDVLPGRKRLSWDTYTWEFHYQLVLLENPFMAYCMSSFFSKKILKSQKMNLVSLSLGRPWRHILSQFHSDDEKHRANSELHIKKAFACTISVETSSHRSLLYMIDISMEWRAALKESQGKKTVAHMLSISHHITLMILATLLLPNYYSKSSFLALVTSKYISTIAILQKAISENFHHTLATTPFMKTSQSHHVKCSNNLRDENYNYSRGDTTRYI